MKPIKSLLQPALLEELATRSNLRRGSEMAKHGAVTFTKSGTYYLIGQVKHKSGQTRTVRLDSTSKGLRWKCSCTSRKDVFCYHCVAAGLQSYNES